MLCLAYTLSKQYSLECYCLQIIYSNVIIVEKKISYYEILDYS